MFWRDMGPTGHACRIYHGRTEFIESLAAYAGSGLWAGEAVVVIAANPTINQLDALLRHSGLDLAHFRSDERYIALSAEGTLSQFLVDDLPDEERFNEVIGGVLGRARRGGRAVRAYGEMVAVLWAAGRYEAALRLEHLWNGLIERVGFRLLCGYPREEFARADPAAREGVRHAHTLFAAA